MTRRMSVKVLRTWCQSWSQVPPCLSSCPRWPSSTSSCAQAASRGCLLGQPPSTTSGRRGQSSPWSAWRPSLSVHERPGTCGGLCSLQHPKNLTDHLHLLPIYPDHVFHDSCYFCLPMTQHFQ